MATSRTGREDGRADAGSCRTNSSCQNPCLPNSVANPPGTTQLRESTAKRDESRYQRTEARGCHEVELVNQDADLMHIAGKDYE